MSEHLLLTLGEGLAPVALLIALGYVWRLTAPGGLDALSARRAINMLVMYAFYPGLAYHVVSHARFGADFWWVPLYTWIGLLMAAGIAWLVFARSGLFPGLGRRQLGALILACSFGNILSIGLSVLQPLYGSGAARFAIYADILGIGILFWSLGAGLASAWGCNGDGTFRLSLFVRTFVRLPPVWAFATGFTVNLLGLPNPAPIARTAELLGQAVVPAMLLTIGMSLSPAALRQRPGLLAMAGLLKLVVMPAIVAALCLPFLGRNEMTVSIVLLAGMPTMMATIMLSERFGLDTELLASVMVATTLLYFIVLPLWLWVLL
jgi:malate permease and related proteins